jgi:HD superfamily phosphohydrolase
MNNSVEAALQDGFTEPVRDALWGHVYLTPQLEAIIKSAPFMRLHRIAQLGPACLCYPGATHTRAAHSIGVYHITRRLLSNLAQRGAASWLTPVGIRSMLCAALLHDLGHFPYAHSLRELPLKEHEELSALAIKTEPVRSLTAACGADPDMTAAIVDIEKKENNDTDGELLFYRKLLSGCLDPDKLDYLNRDARYCGVPYGAQDVDFILSILVPHKERGVDIDSKGITCVESVLFSKYLMYRSVYWHHSVRSADAMVKKALFTARDKGIIAGKDLFSLDDQGLFSLMRERQSPLSSKLCENVLQGKLFGMAAEFPYNPADHGGLCDLKKRAVYEAEIAEELSIKTGLHVTDGQIVIDLPDTVNFETNLFVRDENCYFDESSSIFKKETVATIENTLRVVRIFVDQDIKNSVKSTIRSREWKFII